MVIDDESPVARRDVGVSGQDRAHHRTSHQVSMPVALEMKTRLAAQFFLAQQAPILSEQIRIRNLAKTCEPQVDLS